MVDRRHFLQSTAAAVPLVCTIAGKPVEVLNPDDVKLADEAASKVERPTTAKASSATVPSEFPTPQPAPGGQVREYWIQARSVRWDIAPKKVDEWMKHRITGRTRFRAFVYQQMSPGFTDAIGKACMPGPTLEAEVGDLLVVHFRNGDTRLNQAVTMHPHGVKYNPEYDGSYLGDHTRAGGFIAPGEEFTYRWECTPDSVGVWPYHDHGPNHTLNTMRGLFGAVIVREKGAKKPDVEQVLMMHSFAPQVTRLPRLFHAVNGRSGAGNTPTVQASVGQDVAFHVIGFDSNFHTFHLHGHRWKDPAGTFVDNPGFGPNETVTARFTEDNPGRWLYHCHVFSHQDAGMAGWYLVS
jgi:FtsP/CotA-like multicopper oxidase with cupredoxin domain